MLTQLAPITTTVIVRGIVEQLADRGIVEQLIAPQCLFEVVLTSKYLWSLQWDDNRLNIAKCCEVPERN